VIAKEEAIAKAKRNYGYFVLLSNKVKDAVNALEIYRNKDLVEKTFHNLKEGLNLRRTTVPSEQSLDGKLLYSSSFLFSYPTSKRKYRIIICLKTIQCKNFWMSSM